MAGKRECVEALRKAGIKRGDIVMVHSSLRNIGAFNGVEKADKEGFLQSILDVFDEVLDFQNAGTLVTPTFSYSYARHQEPFHYETTPADPLMGAFSEFIRRRPDALRSVHPLNSLSAVGVRKSDVCADVSRSSYGYNSAFDRLVKHDAWLLMLGVTFARMTFVHHIEHMAGISHFYHKAYFTPAFKDGKPLPLPFMAFVRYLNNQVEIYTERLEKHMVENGYVTQGLFGGAPFMLVRARDVFEVGYKLIQENPCLLIKEPYYTTA